MSDMGDKAEQLKGQAKEAAGDLTGDEQLKQEGKADRIAGETKEKLEQVKEKAEELIDKAKEAASELIDKAKEKLSKDKDK